MAVGRRLSLAVAVVAVGAAGVAHAEPVAPGDVHPVVFQLGWPATSMDVIGPASDVTCGKRCELKLSPGLYQLVVTHHNGDRSIQKVRVSGPSRIIVTPENRTVRFSGFLLMAMGAGIYIAGAFGLLWGALDKMGEEGASCAAGDCDLVYAGLVGMGAGAVVGGIGAVMYLVNRRPHVDVTPPLEPPPSAAPPPQARLQLQPAAGPRWMGLALSGSF